MTEITDQDKRDARQWATMMQEQRAGYPNAYTAARVILATVEPPAPTLAEELRETAGMMGYAAVKAPEIRGRIEDAAARAKQIEKDLDEARAAAKTWQEQNENDCEMYSEEITGLLATLDETRDEVTVWKRRTDRARAEVERLTADGFEKEVLDTIDAHYSAPVQQANSLKTPNSSFKSSLKEPAQNPADVKPGEAWIVEFEGHSTIGKRDTVDEEVPWALLEGRWVSDSAITLVSRLVPAPRVITDPDELDRLAATSIIRDGRGWPGGITDQGVAMINGVCLSDEEVLAHGPVTVLWEAGE